MVFIVDPDELDDADCIDSDGEVWPEHNYDEIDCRRCGAEAGTY